MSTTCTNKWLIIGTLMCHTTNSQQIKSKTLLPYVNYQLNPTTRTRLRLCVPFNDKSKKCYKSKLDYIYNNYIDYF